MGSWVFRKYNCGLLNYKAPPIKEELYGISLVRLLVDLCEIQYIYKLVFLSHLGVYQ